jgi:hypothetical protein
MEREKSQKVVKKFFCKKCNYTCSRLYDYNKHLLTAKHNMERVEREKSQKVVNKFSCECGKTYKVSSGLWKHKKKCSYISEPKNEIIETTEATTTNKDQLILELLAQNKELINLLNDTVPKIGNTTNNITNNNQFNLQVFLNEDCKDALNFSDFINNMQITFEDLENQAQIGYANGISKLFIENLQELGTHKRPIHCTDKKRNVLYIKENNSWNKDNSQESLKKGIQEVTRRTQEELMKKKEENSSEYENMESEFSEKCISIQNNLIPDAPRETTINKVINNISRKTEIQEKNIV